VSLSDDEREEEEKEGEGDAELESARELSCRGLTVWLPLFKTWIQPLTSRKESLAVIPVSNV
jgi:hypothetical protein